MIQSDNESDYLEENSECSNIKTTASLMKNNIEQDHRILDIAHAGAVALNRINEKSRL